MNQDTREPLNCLGKHCIQWNLVIECSDKTNPSSNTNKVYLLVPTLCIYKQGNVHGPNILVIMRFHCTYDTINLFILNFYYNYTLLKPKRHSLRCHDFMVHAFLLRMCTNVVYLRVMRRLCRREWNWLWNWRCVNQHSWDLWQRTTWSQRVTSDFNSVFFF